MPDRPDRAEAPPPLTVAASLAATEGLVLLGVAIVELADLSADRRALGLSVAAFFGLYGVVLVGAAWAVWRRHPWSRGPVLITQLIMLGLAWNLRDYTVLAVVMAVAAIVVIVGLVHPDSIDALDRGEPG